NRGEDVPIRPYAERQREHGHSGEAGVLQQLAEGELEIVHTVCQWSVVSGQWSVVHPAFGFRPSGFFRISSFGFHSHLSASMGSTLAARRAGTKLASNATPNSTNETVPNVSGSAVPTPNSKLLNSRADASAATNPT